MAETTHDEHGHGGHDEIHLPPNSWVPLSTAVSITAVLIGFLTGWWLVIIGGVALIASLVAWLRAARNEFEELPD
jgi:hypothetical protein